MKITKENKQQWVEWFKTYGAKKFLDAFLRNVENAKSTCKYCKKSIFVDVMIGGGVPDWSTKDGDFGCSRNPRNSDEGTCGHMPVKRNSKDSY